MCWTSPSCWTEPATVSLRDTQIGSGYDSSGQAQATWEKYTSQASAFVPGTSAHRFFKGKKVLYMTQEQALAVDRLAREYGNIQGFK